MLAVLTNRHKAEVKFMLRLLSHFSGSIPVLTRESAVSRVIGFHLPFVFTFFSAFNLLRNWR